MREERVLRKLKSGDPGGLEELMEGYLPYVSAVVWHLLRGSMQAEDMEEVVSDVFLAAWKQPEDLRPGKVKPWLGAVARHKAKNKLRELAALCLWRRTRWSGPTRPTLPPRPSGARSGRWCAARWTRFCRPTARYFSATTTMSRP